MEEFNNFEKGIPTNTSEFLHSFLFHFMESVSRCKFDFEVNIDEMLAEKVTEYQETLEKHFYVSIVKSMGLICTDKKKFEQLLKTLHRDVFKEFSVFDYTVLDAEGDFRKIDNVTSEAFLHKFKNIEDVLLPTLNVYYLLH